MSIRRAVAVGAVSLGLTMALASVAQAHSGSVNWGHWTFDWEVRDNAGLAIRNVKFDGKTILYKASLPVIRVRYKDDQCGPYADRINWDNLLSISNCNDAKVCQRSMKVDVHDWFEIDVLAGIGKYRITQAWWFSDDGWLHPRMSSKGLHCDLDHEHHAYWRMDFDVDGSGSDQMFTYNKPGGGCGADEGYGPGWHKWVSEAREIKMAALERRWWVQDSVTGNGAGLYSGNEDDGDADGWALLDTAAQLYHSSEDVEWPFGSSDLGWENGEAVHESDNVTWSIAHLYHKAAGGGDHWHRVGPWVWVKH